MVSGGVSQWVLHFACWYGRWSSDGCGRGCGVAKKKKDTPTGQRRHLFRAQKARMREIADMRKREENDPGKKKPPVLDDKGLLT